MALDKSSTTNVKNIYVLLAVFSVLLAFFVLKSRPENILMPKLKLLAAFLLAVWLYFPCVASAGVEDHQDVTALAAPIGCDLLFNRSSVTSHGERGSVALHSSGLVLFFNAEDVPGHKPGISYRVGKLNGTIVTYGALHSYPTIGYRPAVILSEQGYVILVFSDQDNPNGSDQFYQVGTIDPNGDIHQTIHWRTEVIFYDRGFDTSIAMNDKGVIVGVHESHNGSSTRLYYRVGHLLNPTGGDYRIGWDSGDTGIGYDNGVSPHIGINNLNQVVVVHQVPNETLVHYRRGIVTGDNHHFATIAFQESKRYGDFARNPAVALLDSGLVLEAHTDNGLQSRVGALDPSNLQNIDWAPSVKVIGVESVAFPGIATNGNDAIVVYAESEEMLYSAVPICQAYRP
jgi:hypothetical protein